MPVADQPVALPHLENAWPDVRRETFHRLSLDVGELGFRNLAVDGLVVVAEVYPAVRAAPDWSTIAMTTTSVDKRADDAAWVLTRQQEAPGRLKSTTRLELTAAGHIFVRFELAALSDVSVNRWGLNVCLDARSWAGAQISAADWADELPRRIGPQRVLDGSIRGLFPATDTLELVRPGGDRLRLSSMGQVLEAEDQRNWTDPTYKIYSGSLADPWPIELRAGTTWIQELTLTADLPPTEPRQAAAVVAVGPVRELPEIGVQLHERAGLPSDAVASVLRELAVDHVRLDLEQSDLAATLRSLPEGLGLELAVLASGDGESERTRLLSLVETARTGVRVLWHLDHRRTTGADDLAQVRSRLAGTAATVVGGTDAYFVDLNRDRPTVDGAVSFSVTPTVHTTVSEIVFASLAAQAVAVRQAGELFGAEVLVSPITLAVRGTPETEHEARHRSETLGSDPRSQTLEGAAWTIGSVHALLWAGARSGTWHDLAGAGGIVGQDQDQLTYTPAFHALAALGASSRTRAQTVGDPGSAWVGIHLGDLDRLVVASLRPFTQALLLPPLDAPVGRRRRLSPAQVPAARSVARWWDAPEAATASPFEQLILDPFEISVFDLAAS